MKRLLIIAAVLTMFAVDGSQALVSAQPATRGPSAATPRLGTLTATRSFLDTVPARRVDLRDIEQRQGFRVHDRHWSWLFPHAAVPPFASDPLQRRHWWADPLLRRHWWE